MTLSVDGNEDRTVKIQKGLTISEQGWETDPGFAFDGWYRDEALAEEYDFSTPVTEDFQLYGTVKKESDAALFTTKIGEDYGLTGVVISGVTKNATLPEDLVLPERIGGESVTAILIST